MEVKGLEELIDFDAIYICQTWTFGLPAFLSGVHIHLETFWTPQSALALPIS
jgi:hypothetical protein